MSKVKYIFQFCDGGSCRKAGSEQVIRDARAYLKNQGLWQEVHTLKTRCNGRCEDAPTWIVQPGNCWYKNLDPEKGIEILNSHLQAAEPLEDYLLYRQGWDALSSDKERPKEAITFKESCDEQLGPLLKARMASSEQDLYPLFCYIFERYEQVLVQQPGQAPRILLHKPEVVYTDAFDISIQAPDFKLKLAIAPLPMDAAGELAQRKVGLTELFRLKSGAGEADMRSETGMSPGQAMAGRAAITAGSVIIKEATTEEEAIKEHDAITAGTAMAQEGIRFKNRKGEELLSIWFTQKKGEIWQHILRNFLDGIPDPDERDLQLHEA